MSAGVVNVPDLDFDPDHPPEALQELAFVEDQVIVPDVEYMMFTDLAVIVTEGAGVVANNRFAQRITMTINIDLVTYIVFIVATP